MEGEQIETLVGVKNLGQKFLLKPVLNDISFEVANGEALGIFGLRGSGKSSLLHIIAGVDRFSSGSVEVLGCNVRKEQRFKRHVGLVTQEASLFQDLNAAENLDFIAALRGAGWKDIERVVGEMELDDFLKLPLSILEAGIYQRLALACALLNSPQLLILDEPVKDIDLYSRSLILKRLRVFVDQGGALICAFSNMEFAPYFDRVGWLENGELDFYEPSAAQEKWAGLLDSFREAGAAGDD